MALADVLRQRVSRRGRTAEVSCGELGTLTVEALPPRECAALGMADSGRALLYAACRELQAAGETLRRERRLFTPDEVTQYVSDSEALAAARTVLALSGVTPDSLDNTENRLEAVQDSEKDFSEIRLPSVQDADGPMPEAPETGENRLDSVQESGKQFFEIRPAFVQEAEVLLEGSQGDGQVSREFSENGTPVRKTPSMVAVLDFEPQNLALSETNGGFMSPLERPGETAERSGATAEPHESKSEFREGLHETESEFPEKAAGALHEITSEFAPETPRFLHETTSELPGSMHESKSEFAADGHQALHESKSEVPEGLHETESDFQEGLHETKSEFGEDRREVLHETTSELAERVAARLLEGLRRAAAVR